MLGGLSLKDYILFGVAIALGLYVWNCEHEKTKAAKFLGGVQALAHQAEIDRSDAIKEGIENKGKVDAENAYLRGRVLSLSGELRDARSSRGFLPSAGPGSGVAPSVTLLGADLERALQRLDDGVSRLLVEGDQAIVDLNSARDWASRR